jgi:hypothetical protein
MVLRRLAAALARNMMMVEFGAEFSDLKFMKTNDGRGRSPRLSQSCPQKFSFNTFGGTHPL